jgi:hypothetical protein
MKSDSKNRHTGTGTVHMTPWDGNGAAIPRYGDRGLILFLGLQAFDLFPGARIPNQRAGVNAISPYACMVSRMDWRAYVKWSFFFRSCSCVHWAFSMALFGRGGKRIYPFFTAFSLVLPVFFSFSVIDTCR